MTENNIDNNDEFDVTNTDNIQTEHNFDKESDNASESSSEDKKEIVKKEKERKLHTRRCPHCKQEYQTKIGADNWKNLFRKPNLDDFIVLIILLLLMAAAFAYTTETKTCRETLANLDQVCMQRQANLTRQVDMNPGYFPSLNYSNNDTLNESTSEVNSNGSGSNLTEYNLDNTTTYTNYSSNLTTVNLSNVSG